MYKEGKKQNFGMKITCYRNNPKTTFLLKREEEKKITMLNKKIS